MRNFEKLVEQVEKRGCVFYQITQTDNPKYYSGRVVVNAAGFELVLLYSMSRATVCVIDGGIYYKVML